MTSNIISFIQHLKLAQEHSQDFCRQYPGSKGEILFKNYSKRVEWILKDMITTRAFTDVIRDGIRREVNSDLMAIPSINEKIALLNPVHREVIEDTIDQILNGEMELTT